MRVPVVAGVAALVAGCAYEREGCDSLGVFSFGECDALSRLAADPVWTVRADAARANLLWESGRNLFCDPRLAVYPDELPAEDRTFTCETCHDLSAGGADPRGTPTSMGLWPDPGKDPTRIAYTAHNTPTVLNAGFIDPELGGCWGWTGDFDDLTDQISLPLTKETLYANVGCRPDDPETCAVGDLVRERYADAHLATTEVPVDLRTKDDLYAWALDALAVYVGSLVSADSPFDRAMAGTRGALGEQEIRGASLFVGKGHCDECHSGPMLSDFEFHDIGAPNLTDLGRAKPKVDTSVPESHAACPDLASEADAGKFRTPSLREVGRTAPYLHDGSVPGLWEVVHGYGHGWSDSANLGSQDPLVHDLQLTDDQVTDLTAFLEALQLGPRAVPLRGRCAVIGVVAAIGAAHAGGDAASEALDLRSGFRWTPGGYVDLGWFDVQGDGVSFRSVRTLPDGTWRYTGDPWAATVNSQGESSDLGNDFDNLQRYDALHTGGKSTFLVNVVEQNVRVEDLAHGLSASGAVWLEPRPGAAGSLGDQLSIDRAQVDWVPRAWRAFPDAAFQLTAGKFDSAFGVEYESRRAPKRFGITPSLVSRYTVGTPTGIKGRWDAPVVGDARLTSTLSLTNGTTTTERFGHLSDQVDRNGRPTATLHVRASDFWHGLTVRAGASGEAGVQDGVAHGPLMTQVGADLQVDVEALRIVGEVVHVDADRGPVAYGGERLQAVGGYVEGSVQYGRWVRPLFRYDRRRGTLYTGPNLYDSDLSRVTAGIAFTGNPHAIAKVEYLRLTERLGPPIDDDVVTTSFVFSY